MQLPRSEEFIFLGDNGAKWTSVAEVRWDFSLFSVQWGDRSDSFCPALRCCRSSIHSELLRTIRCWLAISLLNETTVKHTTCCTYFFFFFFFLFYFYLTENRTKDSRSHVILPIGSTELGNCEKKNTHTPIFNSGQWYIVFFFSSFFSLIRSLMGGSRIDRNRNRKRFRLSAYPRRPGTGA